MAKILIIEDEPALAKSLEFVLKERHEVLTATSGKAGLQKAKKELPDLILLDVMLPDMDGMGILKELKADEKTDGIMVIVLTNLSDKETVSRIIQSGGREYLVKSDWSIDGIAKKIEESL